MSLAEASSIWEERFLRENTVPWTSEAEQALRRRIAAEPHAVILESGVGFGEIGRWSIFASPSRVHAGKTLPGEFFSSVGDRWHANLGEGLRLRDPISGTFRHYEPPPSSILPPLDALKTILRERGEHRTWYRDTNTRHYGNPSSLLHPFEAVGVPFISGWVGFVGYDVAQQLERLPRRHPLASDIPEVYFVYCRTMFAIDRLNRIIFNHGGERGHDWLRPFDGSSLPSVAPIATPLVSDFSKPDYLRAAERTLEYIRAGDIFQANLTHRFAATLHPKWRKPGRIADLWDRCMRMSPAPFSALIKTPEWSVLSTSPERFMLLEPNGRVETRPIKGTRPRGKTPTEDAALAAELAASPKDRAELNMIVDLERNDLGRVCEYGSVRVARHAEVESYSNVHHLVSTVEGKLRPGLDVVDLLAATFPGGSITGAPKIRAMEIIDELEACRRGVYTGAIGYISDCGRADFNIAIRTMVVEGDQVHYHVGGGIVADSDPEAEWEETLAKGSKLRAILESLE